MPTSVGRNRSAAHVLLYHSMYSGHVHSSGTDRLRSLLSIPRFLVHIGETAENTALEASASARSIGVRRTAHDRAETLLSPVQSLIICSAVSPSLHIHFASAACNTASKQFSTSPSSSVALPSRPPRRCTPTCYRSLPFRSASQAP